MRSRYDIGRIRHVLRVLVLFTALLIVFGLVGYSCSLRLMAEDMQSDIEFLAQWVRDYSPLAELNEKHKGTPSYETLLPKYLEFAEQAEDNQEFY